MLAGKAYKDKRLWPMLQGKFWLKKTMVNVVQSQYLYFARYALSSVPNRGLFYCIHIDRVLSTTPRAFGQKQVKETAPTLILK